MNSIDAVLTGMRVLITHPVADLYGSDRVLVESVQALLDRGVTVVVALPAPGPLVEELRGRGAHVEFCPTPVLRKALLSPTGLLRLAGECVRGAYQGARLLHRHRPDALYVSTITIPLWPLLGRLARVPVVTHVHEAEKHASPPLKAALAIPLLLADRIVANSHYSLNTLEESLPTLRGRAQMVLNGVPGPPEPVPARATIDDGLRVVYVGRLSHRKGVDLAVEAIAGLRRRGIDVSLDLVGSVALGYEEFEAQLRDRVLKLGLHNRVAFHGFHSSMWRFLAAADVAVVPSRLDEPFGNTAVEAVLATRPLVVSNTSGLREAAAGYDSVLFVEPGDPDGLADALALVATDWNTFRAAATNDCVVATGRHAPERYRQQIADVIRGAVQDKAGRKRPAASRPRAGANTLPDSADRAGAGPAADADNPYPRPRQQPTEEAAE